MYSSMMPLSQLDGADDNKRNYGYGHDEDGVYYPQGIIYSSNPEVKYEEVHGQELVTI